MAMMKQSNTKKDQMKKDGTTRVLKDSPQDDPQIYKRHDMGLNMGTDNLNKGNMKDSKMKNSCTMKKKGEEKKAEMKHEMKEKKVEKKMEKKVDKKRK